MIDVSRIADYEDFRRLARRRLPPFLFDRIDSGAGDGVCTTGNAQAFDRWRLWGRVLNSTHGVDQRTELFGRHYASPFGISPTGMGSLLHPRFDTILAETAREADIPFVLSTTSGLSIAQAAGLSPDHVWFQLYAARDPAITKRLIEQALDAGVATLVMTVDYPIALTANGTIRSGVSLPPNRSVRAWAHLLASALGHPRWALSQLRSGGVPVLGNLRPMAQPNASAAEVLQFQRDQYPAAQSWCALDDVRRLWPGKLVVKGILHPADALRALDAGADAITVSNHGGNVFDRAVASLDALPAVASAVGKRAPVLFDGGIRRGSDAVVALCLGAHFCFVGRPTLYATAGAGAAGATRMVELLRTGIATAMTGMGCTTTAELESACVRHRDAPLVAANVKPASEPGMTTWREVGAALQPRRLAS